MVQPLQRPDSMRISVGLPLLPLLGALLLVGALAAPARADRTPIAKRHGVAAIAARSRADASATSLTTGDLRLTGAARREWRERPAQLRSPRRR